MADVSDVLARDYLKIKIRISVFVRIITVRINKKRKK